MKNILKHIVSFSMILILLVSTLQFSLYKMECILSGNTTLSLTEFDDCNKDPASDCSFSEKCCCFHQINFDFEFDTNFNIKSFQILNTPILAEESLLSPSTVYIENKPTFFFTNLPPPGGTELLKRVQVFRL